MKCHYEILGVGRDANDDEIKKSYRKLALKWHPDKNISSPEVAREQFQLIQQAYEVLIDSHERCFYDNHREQILRGKNSNYEDSSLDVFQYFTVTCFKGYEDDPNGFYHVYAEVFENICSEDAEFMDDEEDILTIPKFGNSQSNYENVVGPFYAYWQSYCTKKTYTWLCKYDITEIKDRRILREIDKETKKIAQKAKKERNEEIRNLVSFVRKRDKRVQAYRRQLEEKAEQNRKKQELNRIEQIRKRQRELEEMKNSQSANTLKPDGYEDQLRQLEQEYGEESDNDNDDNESYTDNGDENNFDYDCDETQYYDDLYCIACNKAFKNENAFINHKISQKHLTNVDKLTIKMALEENEYLVGNDNKNNCDSKEMDDLDKIVKDDKLSINEDEGSQEDGEEDYETKTESKKSKKKKSKKYQPPKVETDIEKEQEEIPDLLANINVEKDENWQDDNKKSGKKSKSKKPNKQEVKKIGKGSEVALQGTSTNIVETAEQPAKSKKIPTVVKENHGIDTAHVCVTCKATFESKNKLFTHLKRMNHGVYIPKEFVASPNVNGHSTKKGKKK